MCRKLTCLISFTLVLSVMLPCRADTADPSLVGWWKLDGNALDSSGNGRDGTLAGDAHYVQGYRGQALSLDGDGDYLTIEGYLGVFSASPVTVTAWVNTTATGDEGDIAYWGRNAGRRRVDFRINSGRLRVEHGSGNLQGDTSLNDGEWHHVALTMPALAPVEHPPVCLYLDGRDDSRDTKDPDYFELVENAGNVDLTFGRRVVQDDRHFLGMMDDIRMFERELPAVQIRDIMQLGYLATAYNPDPADGDKLEATWGTLKWSAGPPAASHDVYFSTSFDDVNAGAEAAFVGNINSDTQPVGFPGFPAPDGLVPGTTYYWRVDEVNDTHPDSPWRGDVWSFWIPSVLAYAPVPGDGEAAEQTDVVLSWSPAMHTIMTSVYFGTDADEIANATGGPPHAGTIYNPGPLDPDTRYYWRVDTFNGSEWLTGNVWTFKTRPIIPLAEDPNLVAHWKLDEGSGTTTLDWSGHGYHGKLFGTEWTHPGWLYDADNALSFADEGYVAIEELNYSGGGRREVTACAWIRTSDPGGQYILSFDRSEYYRLQINGEVAGPGQVGWQVMTMRGSTEVQMDYGSVTRVDDGLWHHVCGVFDNGVSTIYIDGLPEPSVSWGGWTYGIGDLVRYGFMGRGSEATEFNGNINSGTIGIIGDQGDLMIFDKALTQDEILEIMRGDPLMAWDLRPTNGRILEVDTVSSVTWRPGDEAVQHDVYFGDDMDAISNADASDTTGIYRGRQSNTLFSPREGFEWGQTYYWRIDEINSDSSITKGRARAINIADYLVVESFEDYNDYTPDEIWSTWIDGFGSTTNGALAGHPEPIDFSIGEHYVETATVHSGRQSMPLYYDNNLKYSEVLRTFASPMNWTRHEVTQLSVWYNGDLANTAEPLYVAIANSTGSPAVVYNDDPNLVTTAWTEWIIPLQAFAEQGVNLTRVNSIAIGLGTKGTTTTAGGSGVLYIDDIRLYRSRLLAIENFSFEQPGTEKQTGFDEVPGWNTDGPCVDSGVETGYTPTDGDWTAYLMSGDPSVWQLTDYTMTQWDVLELKVDARITWAATTLKMSLYYDDNGARVPVASSEVALTDDMQEYTLSVSAGDIPDAVGHKIGIEFSNISEGNTWVGLDNIQLEVSAQ